MCLVSSKDDCVDSWEVLLEQDDVLNIMLFVIRSA